MLGGANQVANRVFLLPHLTPESGRFRRRSRPSGTYAIPVIPRARRELDDNIVSRARGAAVCAAIGGAVGLLRVAHEAYTKRVRHSESKAGDLDPGSLPDAHTRARLPSTGASRRRGCGECRQDRGLCWRCDGRHGGSGW